MSHQHVGLQTGVRALDSEQVAVLSHDFMSDKAATEHCRKGLADVVSELGEGCGVQFLMAERHCGNLDGTCQDSAEMED